MVNSEDIKQEWEEKKMPTKQLACHLCILEKKPFTTI
jgi:hypothetical protein